ncbi:MAG: metal-dependent hydrolase, partial [Deltaproteobacteria bacterium]|nr:metal-dependent hydrolase [Deltaproteobacteria bacterium]
PWVYGNPACPEENKKLKQIDLMLITHGHGDHIGDALKIAREFKPTVVAIYETSLWLKSKGIENVSAMNKGGTQSAVGVKITMTNALHSCGIEDEGKIIYGGEAAGYLITFSNGRVFYHAGDTGIFGDMALIQELYKPDTAFLPIGDIFTMSPREAAHACKLLQTDKVVPMHHSTFPVMPGKSMHLKEFLTGSKTKVMDFKPGETQNI